LADEFRRILISYARPDGNFLEHETLQRGLLWGIGRLAHARPQSLKGSVDNLHPFFQSKDTQLRGLAVWAAGPLRNNNTTNLLKQLTSDTAALTIYLNRQLISCSVAELAKTAIEDGT
jgi:hypothetical protein